MRCFDARPWKWLVLDEDALLACRRWSQKVCQASLDDARARLGTAMSNSRPEPGPAPTLESINPCNLEFEHEDVRMRSLRCHQSIRRGRFGLWSIFQQVIVHHQVSQRRRKGETAVGGRRLKETQFATTAKQCQTCWVDGKRWIF